ncbi:MAG: HemK family protein methyltransferase, partial [Synergistaceae bacterium]|nr:HemK family protein methyltransferase [Synergistaceae bacterium]
MNKNWNVSSLRSEMSRALEEMGVTLPGLEADRIICAELTMPRASLMAHPELEIPHDKACGMLEFASRRAAGEPLAYVIKDAVFCGRNFFVDKRVLIPRTETEILTELADGLLKRRPEGVFADWCTGSGCVAVTLLAQNQGCRAYAVDVSEDALDVARFNAGRHAVHGRLKFIRCGK